MMNPKDSSQYTFNEQSTRRQLLRMRRLRESTVLLPSKTSDNSRCITNLDVDDNKNSLFMKLSAYIFSLILCLSIYIVMVTNFLWYEKLAISVLSISIISIIDKFLIAKNKICRIIHLIVFLLIFMYIAWGMFL